jgi:SAM-dependent methyltransferase
MTLFEAIYRLFLPFEHPLHQRVNRTLRALKPTLLLDVGGRRSNYTIGLPGKVWITDLPRTSLHQHELDLGATEMLRAAVLKRRSNVATYLYDDMTDTKLPANHFDVVNAVEVLEHVDDDEAFVANVARLLKPGGSFVMTTPNGDWRPIPFPDHKRHYRAADLTALLKRHFADVEVEHRVNADLLFTIGYRAGLLGMWAYGLSAILERLGLGSRRVIKKHHLFVVCRAPIKISTARIDSPHLRK